MSGIEGEKQIYMTHEARYPLDPAQHELAIKEIMREYSNLKIKHPGITEQGLPVGCTFYGPVIKDEKEVLTSLAHIALAGTNGFCLELVVEKQTQSLVPIKGFHEIGHKYMEM